MRVTVPRSRQRRTPPARRAAPLGRRRLGRESGRVAVGRAVRLIERLQRQGLADAAMDAEFTAACLGAMVLRVGYASFVISEIPVDVDWAVMTTTRDLGESDRPRPGPA